MCLEFPKMNLSSAKNIKLKSRVSPLLSRKRLLRALLVGAVLCCGLSALSGRAAVMVKAKMWPQESELQVVFLDGSEALRTQIRRVAPLWLAGTNLSFRFFDDLSQVKNGSQIRVSFASHTGSMLGNHGDFGSREPTVVLKQLAQLRDDPASSRRLILHEFGHALGLEHEFLSPNWPYGNAALEKFVVECHGQMETIGYSRAEALTHCQSINRRLDSKLVKATVFDEHSVMNYPQTVTDEQGDARFIEARTRLSILDKYALQTWYRP